MLKFFYDDDKICIQDGPTKFYDDDRISHKMEWIKGEIKVGENFLPIRN